MDTKAKEIMIKQNFLKYKFSPEKRDIPILSGQVVPCNIRPPILIIMLIRFFLRGSHPAL